MNLSKVCCGLYVVRDPTTASSNQSDMFVRPSVGDITTSRHEINALVSLNWILEPGDEDQKNRGKEWKKMRERGLERLSKGTREGKACYFTAVWKIWLTWGCPTLQEMASPGERERQTRAIAWGGVCEGVEWRESEGEEWMEFRVCVSGGVLWGQFSYFCFYREDKITAWNLPFSGAH